MIGYGCGYEYETRHTKEIIKSSLCIYAVTKHVEEYIFETKNVQCTPFFSKSPFSSFSIIISYVYARMVPLFPEEKTRVAKNK